MTKSELIQRLAERNPHLYQRDVERIVTAIFDEIAAALSRIAPLHRERAEAAQLDAVAACQRAGDLVEYS